MALDAIYKFVRVTDCQLMYKVITTIKGNIRI